MPRMTQGRRTSYSVPSIPSCGSGVEKPISARSSPRGFWDERSGHSRRRQRSATRAEGNALEAGGVGPCTPSRRISLSTRSTILHAHCGGLISWSISRGSIDSACLFSTIRGVEGRGLRPRGCKKRSMESFASSAWGSRARALVLSPELEMWIWSDSPHIDEVAGWKNRNPGLRPWLIEQAYLQEGEVKPARPKEAFEAALREAGKPRSASFVSADCRKGVLAPLHRYGFPGTQRYSEQLVPA